MNPKIDNDDLAIVFTSAGPLKESGTAELYEEYGLVELSGYMMTSSGVASPSNLDNFKNISLSKARQYGGEWCGIFKSTFKSESFAITVDPFGYQTLFYRLEKSQQNGLEIFAATTASALSYLLQRHGKHVDINWIELVGTLGTEQHWARTMQSSNTFGKNVSVLLPGETLFINEEGVYLERGSLFTDSAKSYDALLGQGIEKAIATIQLAANLPVESRDINLSGGRDSRMIMAMMTAAGIESNFTVTTVNPWTWSNVKARRGLREDLYIAGAMRQRYGMKWSPARNYKYTPLTFDESLQYWQNFRSNQYYYFNPVDGINSVDGGVAELRGAAGETFRGFEAVRSLVEVLQLKNRQSTVEEDIKMLLNYVYSSHRLPEEIAEQVVSRAAQILIGTGGSTVMEMMNRRYSLFRNRSHFGHFKYSLNQGAAPIFPLSQVEFIQAAQKLPSFERDSGRIVFDIIERLNPELNDLQFDDGPWADKMYLRGRKAGLLSKSDWHVSTNDHDLFEYFEADRKTRKARTDARTLELVKLGAPSRSHLTQFLDSKIRNLLGNLKSIPSSSGFFTPKFHSQMIAGINSASKDRNVMLARLASAQDMICGNRADRTLKYTMNPANAEDPLHWSHMSLGRANYMQNLVKTGAPIIDLTLKIRERKVEAIISLDGHVDGQVEYAFYLMDSGEVLKKEWYGASNTQCFDLPEGKDSLAVKGFVRYVSNPSIMVSKTALVGITDGNASVRRK